MDSSYILFSGTPNPSSFCIHTLLNFRMWFKYWLKVQKFLAQGVWGHDAFLMPGACGDTMVF